MSAIIPEPFACSAIVHGERVFVAEDMRHDEAVKYARKLGGKAVEGIWISKAFCEQAQADADTPNANYQVQLYRLLAELRKGSFELETPTKE